MAEEGEMERWIVIAIVIVILAALIPVLSKVKRTRGRNPLWHAVFLAVTFLSVFLVPEQIQNALFSETGVLMVGTIIPVYESIVAACTIGQSDDIAWIQFWVVNASLTFSTEWIDVIKEHLPAAGEHWYEFEFFITLWFMLPFTDGSTLVYDFITKPLFLPTAVKLNKFMDSKIEWILAAVNTSYMWILWTVFLTLPEEARRFVVVVVGTVYPIVASTVSVITEADDETFWLTYWSTFSLLFIAMDYLETWVGSIRGFYSLILCATVYLFLPMFRGAEVVFRRVLVPLTGQYENMLLRDTYLVKKEMERKIPGANKKSIMSKAAGVFLDDEKKHA